MHNKKLCSLVSRTHLTNLHSLDYTLEAELYLLASASLFAISSMVYLSPKIRATYSLKD